MKVFLGKSHASLALYGERVRITMKLHKRVQQSFLAATVALLYPAAIAQGQENSAAAPLETPYNYPRFDPPEMDPDFCAFKQQNGFNSIDYAYVITSDTYRPLLKPTSVVIVYRNKDVIDLDNNGIRTRGGTPRIALTSHREDIRFFQERIAVQLRRGCNP
jgi:hypothetical protein